MSMNSTSHREVHSTYQGYMFSDSDDSEDYHRPQKGSDRAWLDRFNRYLDEHLSIESLNVPLMAEAFAMSESTLLRQVKRLTGQTPANLLQAKRLNLALELMQGREVFSVQEAAAAVGYGHTRTFSRAFKQVHGFLPSEVFED